MEKNIIDAYIAGFFDGEGCISLPKYKPNSSNTDKIEVQITNTFLKPLEIIKENFGGCLSFSKRSLKNPKWKDIHHLSLTGKYAKIFLEKMYPYLTVKRSQCEYALKFFDIPRKSNIQNIKGMPEKSKAYSIIKNNEIDLKRNFIRSKLYEFKSMVL